MFTAWEIRVVLLWLLMSTKVVDCLTFKGNRQPLVASVLTKVTYEMQPSLYAGYSSAQSSSFIASTTLLRQDILSQHQSDDTTPVFGRRVMICMGKGDGKKKRKKKNKNKNNSPLNGPSSSSSQESAPLRVTNNINIPIRQQIKFAQMKKEAQRHSGASFRQKRVERTSYRRKWTDEEIEQKREERKRKGQDIDWDVVMNQTSTKPLMIVDGYNIIHKWARLKKHMRKGDLQTARELLVSDLEALQRIKGWRIEVVFDGARRSLVGPLGHGPGNKVRVLAGDRNSRKSVTNEGVRVVFSGVGMEADSYILERCHKAKNVTKGKTTGSLMVATDDGLIRTSAMGAGALCLSAGRMVDELKSVKNIVRNALQASVERIEKKARESRWEGKYRILDEKRDGYKVLVSAKGNRILVKDKKNELERMVEEWNTPKRQDYPPKIAKLLEQRRNNSTKITPARDKK